VSEGAELSSSETRDSDWHRYRWRILAIGFVVVVAGLLTGGLMLGGPTRTPHAAAAVVRPPLAPPPNLDPVALEVRRAIAANAAVRQGSANGRLIALTFDDGPGPYTAAVVSELRRLKAPATFFEIGEMIPAYRTLVANMSRWGFVIGDHTWSHPQLTGLPGAQVTNQIILTQHLITKITGKPVQFMRPPYGAQSARVRTLAGRQGLVTTLWSIDTADWTRPGVGAIVARALAARAGQIILLHDGGGIRSQTVAAIPTIVRTLRRRGFHLVTLQQLLALAPPRFRR
jgi:peptidoglycan/xylan/chitin deacetylase (PgdA/CDA1 family)